MEINLNKKKVKSSKNKIDDSLSGRIFNICNYIFLVLLSLIFLYPLYYVIVASFSDANELILNGNKILLYPLQANTNAYKVVFRYQLVWRGYLNTIFVVVAGVSINMLLTIPGAYYLSRSDLLFRKIITMFIIFTMFFSGGLIPLYLVVRGVRLLDSLWSAILPVALNTYNMIIMRSAFSAVPKNLSDASEIDGANDFLLLWRILVPICIPTIVVLILYYTVGHWNAWFNAFIYISDKTKWPLQVVLRQILISGSEIQGDTGSDTQSIGETIKYAVIVVSTLPILMVYPFIQKYFVKGVMIGSLKG